MGTVTVGLLNTCYQAFINELVGFFFADTYFYHQIVAVIFLQINFSPFGLYDLKFYAVGFYAYHMPFVCILFFSALFP